MVERWAAVGHARPRVGLGAMALALMEPQRPTCRMPKPTTGSFAPSICWSTFLISCLQNADTSPL